MFPWLVWLQPIALAGLLAVAGPIAVHLLRRQRAARIPFASLRFVHAAATAAMRFRLPSDVWLLALRIAIVAAAAAALAQPVFVTPGRVAAWNARLSRAIVVDVSASVATGAPQREEAAAAEARGAVYTVRIDAESLADGLGRAVSALADAPPSRREIVVISDLQQDSLTSADVARVPADVGLRFVPIDAPPKTTTETFQGETLLGAPGIPPRVQEIRVMLDGTAVRWVPRGQPGVRSESDGRTPGLTLVNAGAAEDALLRAVARAGAPAPSAAEPLTLVFGSSPGPTKAGDARMPTWMTRTILAMRRDPVLAEAAREHRRQGPLPDPSSMVVARDASDVPVVTATARQNELLVSVAGGAADYLAAATLRSALTGRRPAPAWGEYELARISIPKLSEWARKPADVDPRAWRSSAPGDARWMWIVVAVLLAVEAIARRSHRSRQQERQAHAA